METRSVLEFGPPISFSADVQFTPGVMEDLLKLHGIELHPPGNESIEQKWNSLASG